MQEISAPHTNRIRQLRKARANCRLMDLAHLVDRGEAMVSRYERGEVEPPLEVARKLATFFDVSVEYLMGWDRQPASEEAAA